MATLNLTAKSDLDQAIPEHWDTKVRRDAARKAFWDKFEGKEASGMPIIVRNDFTKQPGDLVHVQVVSQLGGDGVTGENTLEGNEEKLSLGQFDLSVDWLRHAVAFTKKATKEANFNAVMASNELLSSWLARYKDWDMFNQLITTATPDTLYANDATSDATLGTNDTFGTTELDRLHLALKRKGAIPIRTIRKGKEEVPIFGCVISEVDEYNLSADTVWIDTVRNAASLYKSVEDHPLFIMSIGLYRGMLVYVHHGISGYQGTPLRPEASINGAHTDSVTTITVGPNANKNYTRFFPSSGTISIVGSGGAREFVTYTGKTNNTFTGCTRGATYGGTSSSAAAYTGGELITNLNHKSVQVAFGAEIAARSWGQYPKPVHQEHDYGFEKGIGIESVYGQKAIEDSAGAQPNYLIMDSYAANPSTSI